MPVIYSIISATIFFLQGFGFKVYALKSGPVKAPVVSFNNINFFISFLISLPFAFVNSAVDPNALLWGLLNGTLMCFMIMLYSTAMRIGKIAFNNFVMALAMLIPIVFFAVLGTETLGLFQYIGLGVVIVACFLVSFGQKSNGEQKATPKIAYLYVTIAVILSGTISILSKHFPAVYSDFNEVQFISSSLFASFLITTVWNGISTRFCNTRAFFADKWFVICLAIVVVGTAFGNIVFMIFAGMVESAIFFPICNGLPMILAVLISPVFKEKISLVSLIGILIGIAAIILLNLT